MPITTLISDFDNTLFDWFSVWYASFSAMLEVVAASSAVDRRQLLAEIKAVHQRHGTSEYAFLLEELPSLRQRHTPDQVLESYGRAINAFRSARREALALYPDVRDTLQRIRHSGCQLVIYTESMWYYSNYRFRKLGLDPLVDYIFSPPDHELPPHFDPERHRFYDRKSYQLQHAKHLRLPSGTTKPDADVLRRIMHKVGATPEETIYVGDSLVKDISMAQSAGITDVHAAYGEVHRTEEYQLLRAVSHWTQDMIAQQSAASDATVRPTYALSRFSDLLTMFNFGPHHARR